MRRLTKLVVDGTPDAVGHAHGSSFGAEIRAYLDERVRLSAVGTDLSREEIIEIAGQMLPSHQEYDPELFTEMVAMAGAAGISPSEAVIVGGYTDFIDTVRSVAGGTQFEDTCTAVITPDSSSEGAGFLAQTWDMHASATPHVFLLDVAVDSHPSALVFTTHGTLGQIGMNTAGIAVGINNLTVTDGAIGVTWPFVVRKALKQGDLDAAIRCVLDAQLAGGHSFLLFDSHGRGVMIEATPTQIHTTYLDSIPLVHTNHCLATNTSAVEADRPESLDRSTNDRITDARSAMGTAPHTYDRLVDLLRDERSVCRHPDPEFGYESSGAVIMRPSTGDFWACWGIPSENPFEHFTITDTERPGR